MLTVTDILALNVAPVLLAIIIAVVCQLFAKSASEQIACWVAVGACYAGRLVADEISVSASNSETPSQLTEHLSFAAESLLFPKEAILWVPWCAAVALTLLTLKQWYGGRSSQQPPSGTTSAPPAKRRWPRLMDSSILMGLTMMVLFAVVLTRTFWTSIYFTDAYERWQHVGFVLVPSLALGVCCFPAFLRRHEEEVDRHSSVLVLALSIAGAVILATSGSLRYAMLASAGCNVAVVVFAFCVFARSRVDVAAVCLSCCVALPLVFGVFFADVAWWNAVAVAISFFLYCLFCPGNRSSFYESTLAAILILLPAGAACGFCGYEFWSATQIEAVPDNPYSNY
ncbi:MAG: hypothetical protein AAFU85_02430 [Planctomycetota bacterium]